jgi:hypothetical protein
VRSLGFYSHNFDGLSGIGILDGAHRERFLLVILIEGGRLYRKAMGWSDPPLPGAN